MARNKKIFSLLLLGLLFRLFIIFCLPVRTFDATIKRYHYAAVNLSQGNGYSYFREAPYEPAFYKPPVYPIFLSIIYKIFGVNINAVKIIQAILDTFACLFLFFLVRHYFAERVAFCALWMSLFFPVTAVYANLLNPESLTLFLMVISLWSISKVLLSGKAVFYFISGLSIILMGYCRQEFFIFVFIFGAYMFVSRKKNNTGKLALYVAAVLMIMSPWVFRNYSLAKKFIPLSAGGGIGLTLFHGTLGSVNDDVASLDNFFKNNPEIYTKYQEWYRIEFYSSSSVEEKIAIDRFFEEVALENIRKNPLGFVANSIRNSPRVWINLHADEFTFLNSQKLRMFHLNLRDLARVVKEDSRQLAILSLKYLFFSLIIFYLLTALMGVWIMRSRLSQLLFVLLPLLYAHVFFLFIHISPNYAIPYWSCIIFFSAVGFSFFFASKSGINVV